MYPLPELCNYCGEEKPLTSYRIPRFTREGLTLDEPRRPYRPDKGPSEFYPDGRLQAVDSIITPIDLCSFACALSFWDWSNEQDLALNAGRGG